MKYCIPVLLILFGLACKPTTTQQPELRDTVLISGQWVLDSSSNPRHFRDHLFIPGDGKFYLFSGTDGGSLLLEGTQFAVDSLVSQYGERLFIQLLDSNTLHVSGGYNLEDEYYRRWSTESPQKELNTFLRQNSLRSKAIGWWKLSQRSEWPIDMINSPSTCDSFTLNIRDDGMAIFYLNNQYDSTVDYRYRMRPAAIALSRGCTSTDVKIIMESPGHMKLIQNVPFCDTLVLSKLTTIR